MSGPRTAKKDRCPDTDVSGQRCVLPCRPSAPSGEDRGCYFQPIVINNPAMNRPKPMR